MAYTTNPKNRISRQPQSNLGWRNTPYPSRTYAAIPRAESLGYADVENIVNIFNIKSISMVQ